MNLLKMVEEYEEVNNKARRMEEKIKTILNDILFVVPFDMQKQKVQITDDGIQREEKFIIVYCPVLQTPKGFYKRDFVYVRSAANSFEHQYILSNDEYEVLIKETAEYSKVIYLNLKGKISVVHEIVLQKVFYEVKIGNFEYTFAREFDYEDMLKNILQKKSKVVKYDQVSFLKNYSSQNEKYIDLIQSLGILKEFNTLQKITEFECKEIKVNENLYVRIQTSQQNSTIGGCLYNEIWHLHLNRIEFIHKSVFVKVFSKNGNEILNQNFYWYEIDKKEFEKGITFEEAIELLKK